MVNLIYVSLLGFTSHTKAEHAPLFQQEVFDSVQTTERSISATLIVSLCILQINGPLAKEPNH